MLLVYILINKLRGFHAAMLTFCCDNLTYTKLCGEIHTNSCCDKTNSPPLIQSPTLS